MFLVNVSFFHVIGISIQMPNRYMICLIKDFKLLSVRPVFNFKHLSISFHPQLRMKKKIVYVCIIIAQNKFSIHNKIIRPLVIYLYRIVNNQICNGLLNYVVNLTIPFESHVHIAGNKPNYLRAHVVKSPYAQFEFSVPPCHMQKSFIDLKFLFTGARPVRREFANAFILLPIKIVYVRS